VVFSARRLCHYFQSFMVVVMTDLPIRKVLQKPDVAGRMVRYAVELSDAWMTPYRRYVADGILQ